MKFNNSPQTTTPAVNKPTQDITAVKTPAHTESNPQKGITSTPVIRMNPSEATRSRVFTAKRDAPSQNNDRPSVGIVKNPLPETKRDSGAANDKSVVTVTKPERTLDHNRSRIGETISPDNKVSIRTAPAETDSSHNVKVFSRTRDSSGTLERKFSALNRKDRDIPPTISQKRREVNLTMLDNLSGNSRPGRTGNSTNSVNITVNKTRIVNNFNHATYSYNPHHHDSHHRRYEHVYFDYHNRICTRIVWPGFSFAVYYNFGPWETYHYVYPYQLRRYVFVSLCGYWPANYTYARYYWYGYHPYAWYGYSPVPYEV